MKEEKKESPMGVLWGWGDEALSRKFIGGIILAVLGVAIQMVPYFCVAHIVTLMLSPEQDFRNYMTACIVTLCSYLGKVVFMNLSTVISTAATCARARSARRISPQSWPASHDGVLRYSVRPVQSNDCRPGGRNGALAPDHGSDRKCAGSRCDCRVPAYSGRMALLSLVDSRGGPCGYVRR